LTSTTLVYVDWVNKSSAGVVQDSLKDLDEGSANAAALVHYAATQFALRTDPTVATSQAIYLNAGTDTSSLLPAGYTFNASTTSSTATYSQSFQFKGIKDRRSASAQNRLVDTTDFDSLTFTVSGDFAFLDNNGDGCKTTGANDLTLGGNTLVVTGGTATISLDCKTITIAGTATDQVVTLAFGVDSNGAGNVRQMPVQTLGVSAVWKKGTTTVQTVNLTEASLSFVTNGFSTSVAYMPYGAGISRILYITNRTSNRGAVSITARNEAGTSCASTNFPAVTVPANGIASLAASADAGIAACFGADFNGKVAFTITAGVGPNATDAAATTSTTGVVTLTEAAQTVSASNGTDFNGSATATIAAHASTGTLTGTAAGTVTRSSNRVDVYSAYNVNGNRVTVINTSNGR